jgi:hypothetical protein
MLVQHVVSFTMIAMLTPSFEIGTHSCAMLEHTARTNSRSTAIHGVIEKLH